MNSMNELLQNLSGGDLRSDGRANEVADEVLENPQFLSMLLEGLNEPDDIIRARTAHALEKISRVTPDILREYAPLLIELALKDEVPMVRWHLAMIFGNIVGKENTDEMISILFQLLQDESVFVKSWSIVSLCVIGRTYESKRKKIADKIRTLHHDDSIAIRTRVKKAVSVLEDDKSMPANWYKSRK